MMKLMMTIVLILCVGIVVFADDMVRPDAQEILRAADRARSGFGGMAWRVDVTAMESGRTSQEQLHVRASHGNVLAVTESPANRRGNTLLMHDGKVWFYKPGLSRPVPVSQRQRLLGLASYGDLAGTNYAEQYRAVPLEDALLDDIWCHVYDLRAKERGLLYDRIVLWVCRDRHVGVRADYYTLSDKLLKTARLWYDHVVVLESQREQLFCSRMELREKLISNDKTVLTFSDLQPGPQPAALFHVNRLGR